MVDLLGDGRIGDVVAGADHGGGGLDEQDRLLGNLSPHLLCVIRIVLADSHDLGGQDWGKEVHVGDGDLLTRGEGVLEERASQGQHVLALDGTGGDAGAQPKPDQSHGDRGYQ